MLSSDQEGAELSLSPDRISVYACSISLTAEKEDLGTIGINYEATGVFQDVRKAYFDRRTTQSEFCFETSILCNRRSV